MTTITITSEQLVYLAKLDEQTERYEDMVDCMKKYVTLKPVLNIEERNLLSVAYKNSIARRRTAWRSIASLEQREEARGVSKNIAMLKQVKSKIEEELSAISREVISLIDNVLSANDATNKESQVFYLKMKGDYYRYMAEYLTAEELKKVSGQALETYQKASEIAAKEFSATNPLRLGLALNYSVFKYEIYDDKENACVLAKRAFDDAIAVIDKLTEEEYNDSTTILQLIRDNLSIWTVDLQGEAEAE